MTNSNDKISVGAKGLSANMSSAAIAINNGGTSRASWINQCSFAPLRSRSSPSGASIPAACAMRHTSPNVANGAAT
jgi:hypothetical protein